MKYETSSEEASTKSESQYSVDFFLICLFIKGLVFVFMLHHAALALIS